MTATPRAARRSAAVSFVDARSAARALAPEPGEEEVPVGESVGRILARPVTATRDHPATDNAAMDGFACRSADLPGRLRIVGESRAGNPFPGVVASGEATEISTGAALPAGADTVLRIEDVTLSAGYVEGPERPAGRDIRRAGEDLRAGEALVDAGGPIRPQALVALITAGHATVLCRRRPRVAVLTSGDELVEPGRVPAAHQLVDGNGPGIAAQAVAAGAIVAERCRVGDDRAANERALARALDPDDAAPPDVVITVGGVSVGRHDHMRASYRAVGVDPVVEGVAVRPGHPTWLGVRGTQAVLGLPGNPVSAAVCFHVLGRPLLGAVDRWRGAPLVEAVDPSPDHARLILCRLGEDGLSPLARQGSADVSALAGADALALISPADRTRRPGDRVDYSPLD